MACSGPSARPPGRSCGPAAGRPCACSSSKSAMHTTGLDCEARLHPAPATPPRCTAHWAVRPAASSMRSRSPLSCASCAAAAISCQLPLQGDRPPRSAGRTHRAFGWPAGSAAVPWPSRPDSLACSAGRSCRPAAGRPGACWHLKSAAHRQPGLRSTPAPVRRPAVRLLALQEPRLHTAGLACEAPHRVQKACTARWCCHAQASWRQNV